MFIRTLANISFFSKVSILSRAPRSRYRRNSLPSIKFWHIFHGKVENLWLSICWKFLKCLFIVSSWCLQNLKHKKTSYRSLKITGNYMHFALWCLIIINSLPSKFVSDEGLTAHFSTVGRPECIYVLSYSYCTNLCQNQ